MNAGKGTRTPRHYPQENLRRWDWLNLARMEVLLAAKIVIAPRSKLDKEWEEYVGNPADAYKQMANLIVIGAIFYTPVAILLCAPIDVAANPPRILEMISWAITYAPLSVGLCGYALARFRSKQIRAGGALAQVKDRVFEVSIVKNRHALLGASLTGLVIAIVVGLVIGVVNPMHQ